MSDKKRKTAAAAGAVAAGKETKPVGGAAATGGRTAVSSTKTVTAAGAKVTTVSIGAHYATSEEPERVTIKADPAAALGVSFAVGGIVRQVAPKGQAAALGIREGWRLTSIGEGDGRKAAGSFSVTATSTSKDVLEALAAARKKGKPYPLSFSTAGTSKQQEEGGGSNEARNCGEAEPQTGNEPRDQEGGEGEALREDKSSRAGLAVGSDEPEAGADGGMGEEGGGKDGGGRREGVEGAEGEGGPAAEGLQEEEPEAGSWDGEVTLMYEMYDEKFPIKDGSLSSADIDETYCLSFVMPNCTLHLGPMSPSDRYARENDGEAVPYLPENPPGTFHGLRDGRVYWVYVSRDDEEERQDRERMKQVVQGMQEDLPEGEAGGQRKDDGRNGLESCSCVYGNPCVDEYGCKDWNSRYAVAKANGWKGF